MARITGDNPASWYGTRTVSWSMPCGYCSYPSQATWETEQPHKCVHEIAWFDKLSICSCECNADWKPVAVVVERDGTIGAVPENLIVAEYMSQKMAKKKAKEEAAAAVVETAKVENASEDALENVEEPEQEVVVNTEDTV